MWDVVLIYRNYYVWLEDDGAGGKGKYDKVKLAHTIRKVLHPHRFIRGHQMSKTTKESPLRYVERELQLISLDPLVTFDHKGIILDVNEATIQATGRTWEELIGTPFADYFTDPERAYRGAMLTFETGEVRDYELVIKASDGTETIVSYNASVYRDQKG